MNLLLQNLLDAARHYAGGEPGDALRRATGAFVDEAFVDDGLLLLGAQALHELPPHGASWLALVLASVAEGNGRVAVTGPLILALLRSWLARLPEVDAAPEDDESAEEPELPTPTPGQAELIDALPALCQALVAHLARMPQMRRDAAKDLPLLDRLYRLERYSHGITWVRELLLRRSGRLVLLHPVAQEGYVVRFENVANCFHLFSLIQHVLGTRMAGARQPDAAIAAAARGHTQAALTDVAWWHYASALSPTPELASTAWGEASPAALPRIGGEQVLLLWPPVLGSRSWDSGFFGPTLEAAPPGISLVERLDHAACVQRLLAIGISPGARQRPAWPWWKRWRRVNPPATAGRFGP